MSGIGATALAVATGRALESRRPDALINDPYAADFLAAANPSTPLPASPEELRDHADAPEEMWTLLTQYIGVRSRVFDDFLTGAARDGIRQVVILASGLDTRPFRLPWPDGVHCFELDQPLVLEFKLRVLREKGATAACAHTPLPFDLRDDWAGALEAAGFDSTLPTAWLAEGLLPYLTPEDEERLFKEIDRLSPSGSRIAVEHGNGIGEVTDDPQLNALSQELDIHLPSLFPEGEKRSPEAQLASLGWQHQTHTAHEAAHHLGRDLSPAPALMDHIRHTHAQRP
ncbi:SAM-dependent methyltransferase [Streptomyces iconiensis]|uniref:S-adenosyl-L-methionine-dependent methyltransferase n=1 Tax=Streptomyces iconiensis TaxID=1384038 RepID=A0ABT7A414_9ACTN|nr:SAM-dependent methyltransferase [Streptomyces iconiensis]MDJ1136087.1 SAM-dependent methyltransferase [Streptomyces iconiensis]